MMVAWYFLSPDAFGAHNLRYIIPMMLGFTCFISGICLMLLSMNLHDLPTKLVSESHRKASKYLSCLCRTLPVVTLLSPLVFSKYKVYRYVGISLLVLMMIPLTVVPWYIGRMSEGGDKDAAHEQHKEQLEAIFKLISAISNSASGGLVSLAVNYNATGGSGQTKIAVLVAAFFIFTTTISGMLSMEIRLKVQEIKSPKLQELIIKLMWLAIVVMLLSLTGVAEVFAIVEFYIFAAFAPLVFAAFVYLFLKYCIRRPAGAAKGSSVNEVQIKWKTERGIKFAMWSITAIIGIFGGFLHGDDKIEHMKACIIFLTSTFLSSSVLTLLTMNTANSINNSFASAITVLDWTAGTTLASAIIAFVIAAILKIQ
uniref:Uncharacterized protein n=1 Tax=Leersia perrieri TaxID=77586 RepID=A0A0D9WRH7_9ORYZ